MQKGWCLALLLFCHPAAADTALGVGTEYFEWREYHPMPLLEESGFRPFVQLDGSFAASSGSDLEGSARLYGGSVAYNGQLMDGTPLRSSSGYTGAIVEVGGAWFLPVMSEDALFLVLRAGMDGWERRLDGSTGYTERYQLLYVRMGLRDEALPGRWSARAGVMLPLAVTERVSLAGGFELKPRGLPSIYLDFGRRIGPSMEVGVAFRRYHLGASDPVWVDLNGDGTKEQVFQPASEADVYSIYGRYGF